MAEVAHELRDADETLAFPAAEDLAARLERWSDRLNPILVRETRQVLKSRQFLCTFMIMLGLAWLISLFSVAEFGGDLEYVEAGPAVFMRYYWVLMVCLFLVVPLGVFRSVSSEFAESSFEMIAVTTMSPGQIVVGKLQSAFVQMIGYSSALAPFLCFTYLLRGIGLIEMGVMLFVLYLVATGLALAAMMLACLAKQSAWQVVNTLLLLAACGIAIVVTGEMVDAFQYGADVESLVAGTVCMAFIFLFVATVSFATATAHFSPTAPPPAYYYSSAVRNGVVPGTLYADGPPTDEETDGGAPTTS
jgi:hypothetical protein